MMATARHISGSGWALGGLALLLLCPSRAYAQEASPAAYVSFQHPLPAWVWAAVVLAVIALAAWSYSRLLGPRPARVVLGALRAAVLLAIVLLLAGPVRVRPHEREDPDAVVILVDRSASMGIRDLVDDSEAVTRHEAVRRALVSQQEVFGKEGLSATTRRLIWQGFADVVRELPPMTQPEAWQMPGVEPTGPATALRTALEQALQAGGGSPLASIVLISDGRTPQSTGVDLVRRIVQRGTRVHVVPVGASEPPFDVGVGAVEAPERAFARDVVPISVMVEEWGGGGDASAPGGERARVRVRLIEVETGREMDVREIEPGSSGPVRLTARSETVGAVRYRVVLEAELAGGRSELMLDNNTREFVVEVLDRPVRVLYVEGYPRWEYRYLKNLLVREESIDSSVLLLSADAAFAQEGDSPITRPPDTLDEIRPYDVVILGDVPPQYFTTGQLQLIRDHVATRGAGLLWIGGERYAPAAYGATPLADLLPMRSPAAVSQFVAGAAVDLEPTPLADALYVMQLQGREGGRASEWPADLPSLRWVQALGELKPTAEVLANAPGIVDARGQGLPLIARLRYGAGQSLYVGTDETWRWRYGRGELYFEQFWVQLVRMLGRERVQSAAHEAVGARLVVTPRQATVGEAVTVELVLDDATAPGAGLSSVAVAARLEGAESEEAAQVLRLQPVAEAEDAGERGRRVYRATWHPAAPGDTVLRVTEPALDAMGLERVITVLAADDELRQVAPDHARLAALAEATGGEVVPLDELWRLVPAVPNLAVKTALDTREPLWSPWLSLMLVVGLLTGEWLVRKALWLV